MVLTAVSPVCRREGWIVLLKLDVWRLKLMRGILFGFDVVDLSGRQLRRGESILDYFITLLDLPISSCPTREGPSLMTDYTYLLLPFLSPHRHNLFTAHPLPNHLHLRAPPHLHARHPLLPPLVTPDVFRSRMDV